MDFAAYWTKIKTVTITALVAGALTLALAACGGDTNSGGTGTTGGNPTATAATNAQPTDAAGGSGSKTNRVDVKLAEWTIEPKQLQIPAGSTTFVATNTGKFSHNFVLQKDGKEVGGTPTFPASDSPKEVTLDLQPGTYTAICTVPGHAQQGMTGTIIVGP
jgi:plastocyanin